VNLEHFSLFFAISLGEYSAESYNLFLLVMNDLHKCLEHSHNVLFVDDVTLLISSKFDDLHNTTPNLDSDLYKVSQFMHSNILELNDDK
jgi:hypothetical protein